MALLRVLTNEQIRPKIRRNSNTIDVYSIRDNDFYVNFGFSKEKFKRLLDFLPESPRSTGGQKCCSKDIQLATTLNFYRTGSPFFEIAEVLQLYSKGTVSKIVTKITDELLVSIVDDFVQFPVDDGLLAVKEHFRKKCRIPGVVGCIDCTHIPVLAPKKGEIAYLHYRRQHSIACQAICDSCGRFLHVYADWPGSTHDSRVLASSKVSMDFENRLLNGVLLGDSGYPCKSWLLTPYLAPVSTSEELYNHVHQSTRSIIERAFGRLKRKFACLGQRSPVRLEPRKGAKVFAVCCALLNFGLEDDLDEEASEDQCEEIGAPYQGPNDGTFRKFVTETYFQS